MMKGGDNMKAQLLQLLFSALMTFCSEEMLKRVADTLLDFVENFVEGTKSPIDDMLILPLCNKVRRVFDIDDNDDVIDPVASFGSTNSKDG